MNSDRNLEDSIDQLAEMIDGARTLAEAGQMVELDVLGLKVAVLTDALSAGAGAGAGPGGDGKLRDGGPYVPRLERLVEALNQLEVTLRKRNVNLTLDLEQADRRLRAQLAYGGERTPKAE